MPVGARGDGAAPSLPPELVSRIAELGRRPPRAVVVELVLAICSWRACSSRELASWLNDRDPKDFTRTYLRPLVAEGRLEHTVPQMPRHPDQKYRVPGVTS